MASVRQIFEAMPGRYVTGQVTTATSYYFSVGDEKWTATMHTDRCEVQEGRHVSNADCVLKCDPKLFEKMVVHGKMPGPIDIARGKIKTNDVDLLKKLKKLFRPG